MVKKARRSEPDPLHNLAPDTFLEIILWRVFGIEYSGLYYLYGDSVLRIAWINIKIFILIWCGLAVFFSTIEAALDVQPKLAMADVNLVRATYPQYAHLPSRRALQIFSEFDAATAEYRSFIGYRRKGFEGTAVNIEPEFGFRISTNHKIDESVWFLGGSTTWGTGADDANTIPSLVAQALDISVLNLGESGFNSTQELIQLHMMLAEGYRPDLVVFYDGINDAKMFCQDDGGPMLKHAYTSRFRKIIDNDPSIDRSISKAEAGIGLNVLGAHFVYFASSPARVITTIFSDEQEVSALSNGKRYESLSPSKKYLYCDEPRRAEKAADYTISAWQAAARLLDAVEADYVFILQPAASFHPERYSLDYIIDYKKQSIANERDSTVGYYLALQERWAKQCQLSNICDHFKDLSTIFFDTTEPIFLDESHIGPAANSLIADEMARVIAARSTAE